MIKEQNVNIRRYAGSVYCKRFLIILLATISTIISATDMKEIKSMNMKEITDRAWLTKWQRNRTIMTLISYILILLYGLEILSVVVSMIYYLMDSFGMDHINASFYYGVIETSCGIGQVFGSLLLGRYVDRTRNLRRVMLMNMAFIMCGNLLYAMPFHLAFLIVGRFLCGMNESLQTAICGEFRRIYKTNELMKVLGYYEIIYSIGVNVGPGMPILFKLLHIRIGAWVINRYNIINLIIAVMTFVLILVSWFMLHDLSKEYDLKLLEEEEAIIIDKADKNNNKHQIKKHENSIVDYSNKIIGWTGLLQVDILLLSLTYGVFRLVTSYAVVVSSMIASTLFSWPVDYLSTCHILFGVASYGCILVLVQRGFFKDSQQIFYVYIIGSLIGVLILIALALPRAIDITQFKSQSVYFAFLLVAKCFSYFIGQTQGKILIFNTVNSESASFIDGFRSAIGSAARLFSLVTSYQYFVTPMYLAVPVVLMQLCMLVWLLYRKKINVLS